MNETVKRELLLVEELREKVRDLTPEQVEPLGERVWLETIPPAELTAAALTIPECAQSPANYAIVRSMGKEIADLTIGDVVMVDAYQGNEITFRTGRYLLVDADQIKARLALQPSGL